MKTKQIKLDAKGFEQRKRIMSMVYDARKLLGVELPWIKVRIVTMGQGHENALGLCYIEKNHIAICESSSEWSDNRLRLVVWHELAHAYFNAKHVAGSPTRAQLEKALKSVKSGNQIALSA